MDVFKLWTTIVKFFSGTLFVSNREAFTTCGYTPFLSFEVVDLQDTVQRLLQMGATLDGPIRYPPRGKVW